MKRILLILIFVLIAPFSVRGGEFIFSRVTVICEKDFNCDRYQDRYDILKNMKLGLGILKEHFKLSLMDDSIKEFRYTIDKTDEGHILVINIHQNPTVEDIDISSNVDLEAEEIIKYIKFKEGDYFKNKHFDSSVENIKEYLNDRGFQDIEIVLKKIETEKGIKLKFIINIGKIIRVKRVEVINEKGEFQFDLEKRFFSLYDQTVDELKFSLLIDRLGVEFFEAGYFLSKVEVLPKIIEGNNIIYRIKVNKGEQHNYSFYGKSIFTRAELISFIREEVKRNVVVLSSNEIINVLKNKFKTRGIYNTQVKLREAKGITKSGQSFKNTYFYINQGHRLPVVNLNFNGNKYFTDEELLDFYYEKATTIASRDILDENYLKEFKKLLRIKYLEKGFIFIDISDPKVFISNKERRAVVTFRIRENDPAIIDKVLLHNVSPEVANKAREKISNKPGTPLNVIALDTDINDIENEVRESGFYFAKIINNNKKDIVKYSKNYEKASLDISFYMGKKVKLKTVLITGNKKTKNTVILREVQLNQDELITPSKISEIRDRLSSLNLFSSINIKPFIINEISDDEFHHANLSITVREKDSISLVVAPGYRTDLGVKLSTELNFNNFGGMDRELSLVARANQRLNFSNLDTRRRREEKRLIEYSLKTSFLEPYLFGNKLEFETSLTGSRRRFRGFDADILGFSASVGKTFWDFFTASVEYQLEIIDQFDATDEKDKGNFRIGSITPTLSIDFRNNKVNPTSGLFMALSWEFANRYFYSQNTDELSINFNRLVSRNKFYISLTDKWSFAFSLSAGVEKNFATQLKNDGSNETIGFIPSVKVFRLDGIDTVRGYRDVEINRVESGEDISDFRIDDKAYFGVFKFEPRYMIDDTKMAALFFDAGRVYVNHFKPLDMRTSAGVSFKLLTPVGSLDFDYGVKLKRKYDTSGGRETFGRFHLSIGFF